MFKRLLIANRGEIACRIVRSARRLGIVTIAVYSDADRHAQHVCAADVAVRIGPAAARESYLDATAILDAARAERAEAIHPGYGFLSENADFAAACVAAGIAFVGPPAEAIRRMGSKSGARRMMAAAGVPVLPGYDGEAQDDASLRAAAASMGLPLLIKPTAGGGGKGMRIVRSIDEFDAALQAARREAQKSFGDARVLLERFVERGRHIEIQVFADTQGAAMHLGERDCSLQRRHQKVIEEAPAPGLAADTRAAMGAAAVAAARTVGYVGAGTIEFLYDGGGFYFLEMNTRLQVEHPVTEMVTGVDLVEWQLRIAAGEPLPLTQDQVRCDGHAIETRLYAEDPARGFLPSTGRLARLRWPEGVDGLRIDSGVAEGDEVSVHYDPMLAKLIAWAPDRPTAITRLRQALARLDIAGIRSNARFAWEVLGSAAVQAGAVSTRWLETEFASDEVARALGERNAWLIAALLRIGAFETPVARTGSPWDLCDGFRLGDRAPIRVPLRCGERRGVVTLVDTGAGWSASLDGLVSRVEACARQGAVHRARIDGRELEALLSVGHGPRLVRIDAQAFEIDEDDAAEHHASAEHEGHLRAPMPGHVLDVRVAVGDSVEAGAVLVILEAMKMEHSLTAPWPGVVQALQARTGERVEEGAQLVSLLPLEAKE